MNTVNLAVILTCHNRREKTKACLQRLLSVRDLHNRKSGMQVSLSIYLTDDGSTDGTADVVREVCAGEDLHVIQGDGNLYWAGGMRVAWREAVANGERWSHYLLLNDDTNVFDNCFEALLEADRYCVEKTGKGGVCSGITCGISNPEEITYGGSVWENKLLGTETLIRPNGKPQPADETNANILLVHRDVVESVGVFSDVYLHSQADFDYANMARRAGFMVCVTGSVCGECECDHADRATERKSIVAMSLSERKEYFRHPLYASADVLAYTRRNLPLRYPLTWLGRMLNIYCPRVYFIADIIRGN